MQIGGLQKTSLIDYPDKISAIVFTVGCNFRCGYCHNPELVSPPFPIFNMTEEELFKFLQKRKKLLDGVTVTGGEPTLHEDLPEFLGKIKKLNFLIKLDTNGTNPEMLKKVIKEKLVDYLAMDIKAPIDNYKDVVFAKVDFKKIKESIKIIMESGLDYEFRSTILPDLHTFEDLLNMAKLVKGAKNYYLQRFESKGKLLDNEYFSKNSFSVQETEKMAKACLKYVKNCSVRL